jgi:peptide deformylase
LSFPGVFFSVNRAKKIVVKFQDLNGKEHRLEADSDLFCRCVQHEIDHLNGKLFVDIALDKVFAMEELAKFGLGDINSPPPLLL